MKNNLDIFSYASFLYKTTFDSKLSIPIEVNKRLKRTIAWFIVDINGNPRIEVSAFLLEQNIYIITDILLHELTHYYLWLNNLPFDDKDQEFIRMVRLIGASETDTLTNDSDMKCKYVEFVASHPGCNFKHRIFVKKADEEYEHPMCKCPKCGKFINYKKQKRKTFDYVPNDKIKEYVRLYHKSLKNPVH